MKYVNYEKKGQVIIITLNRPERLNALGEEVGNGLAWAWQKFNDDDEARVAILTGEGRAFCSGADIKELAVGADVSLSRSDRPRPYNPRSPRFQSKPVIAAVNGLALGAGFDILAMDADICIAAESATFGMPEVIHSLFSLGTPFAIHNISKCITMELLLTGESITAQRAYELGFVNRVVPDAELMHAALTMAEKIASFSPLAVKLMRQNVLNAMDVTKEAYSFESRVTREVHESAEAAKGAKAFKERRRAKP